MWLTERQQAAFRAERNEAAPVRPTPIQRLPGGIFAEFLCPGRPEEGTHLETKEGRDWVTQDDTICDPQLIRFEPTCISWWNNLMMLGEVLHSEAGNAMAICAS